jgi:hypothetical protein
MFGAFVLVSAVCLPFGDDSLMFPLSLPRSRLRRSGRRDAFCLCVWLISETLPFLIIPVSRDTFPARIAFPSTYTSHCYSNTRHPAAYLVQSAFSYRRVNRPEPENKSTITLRILVISSTFPSLIRYSAGCLLGKHLVHPHHRSVVDPR